MKVTVCMGTHNGSKYIRKQIESILFQLDVDDELIISDDGSTDNTVAIINLLNDKRIKLVFFDGKYPKERKYTIINHRISYNFLNALKYASGDIILFSDQDDVWYPNKIKTSMAYLQDYDLVVSNFSIMDSFDNIIQERFYKNMPKVHKYFIAALSPHMTGCAMAFKKSILDYAIPFPDELSCGHDNWIGLCANKYGKIAFIEEPLFLHRVHDSNNSYLGKKSSNSFLQKINWRLTAFVNILKR